MSTVATELGAIRPTTSTSAARWKWEGAKPLQAMITFLLGVVLYFGLPAVAPTPSAVSFRGSVTTPAPHVAVLEHPTPAQAAAAASLEAKRQADWRRGLHLVAIFVTTIVGIVLRPLPMGSVAMAGITLVALTGTLSVGEAFSGFNNKTIWLIALAFFIARAFVKTGFGNRIAYLFMRLLGKRTLGLSYGLIGTDLILAPAIPSNTARTGGIVFPIIKSVAHAYGSDPANGTQRRVGAFLTLAAFQGTVYTSAMFLTSMAANPLAAELASKAGIAVSWTRWAIAGIVPGLVGIAVVPWLLYKLYPPEVKETPAAPQMAREKLAAMGRVSWREWILLATFVTLIVLWVFEKQVGVDNTIAAMIGLGMLQITGVLSWRDVLEESAAWDTIVWFSSLVMMADFLSRLGMIGWFSHSVGASLAGHGWMVTLIILLVVYTYSHYAFASATAHVSAMYPAFVGVSVAAGAPPLLAALAFGFFSNVMGGMTHYGNGPAPVLYGGGYVDIKSWWGYGFLFSLLSIAIWLGVGLLWWKLIGIW